MEISNNLNAMLQIQNHLNNNAYEIAKAGVASQVEIEGTNLEEVAPDITEAMVENISLPIQYSANAEILTTKDSTTGTLLDMLA